MDGVLLKRTSRMGRAAFKSTSMTFFGARPFSLFLVKGQAEIQLIVSELKSSTDEKIVKLLALAKSL